MVEPTTPTPLMNTIGSKGSPVPPIIIGLVLLIGLGIGSGYLFNTMKTGGTSGPVVEGVTQVENGKVEKGKVYGSADEKTFPDSAEGTLEKGGLQGEGSHKLIRPGGDSQTAYLTSTSLDLDQFAGKKVKIWGKTYDSQKGAGWFMDVGRVQVLE